MAMMKCACCQAPLPVAERVEVAVEWEHRLDGYCYFCASMRCDAYPGSHGPGTQVKTAYVQAVHRRATSR
jgi:hypothetical protein